jgi:hypothetical protein
MEVTIYKVDKSHLAMADEIVKSIECAAQVKGNGIAVRSVDYISKKIEEGDGVIALSDTNEYAGFCYIESWNNKTFVANSGLVVVEKFRGQGLARKIKEKAFEISRKKYPNAKLFDLTTSRTVMKINSSLGYTPVIYSELTNDDEFWMGCESCYFYDVLVRTQRKNCLCTAMLFDKE